MYITLLIWFQVAIFDTIIHSWQSSLKSIYNLFRIPNPTFTVLLIFLINGLASRVEVLLPQYISLTLHWPLGTVNSALAGKALVSAVVLLILPTIRRIFLEPRMSTQQIDLFIVQISFTVNIIGMVGLGFALPAPLLIIALFIYNTGVGLGDSLTAYATITLPASVAVSELYVRTALIETIAGMIGSSLWSGLFSLVLRSGFLPSGLPFWITAGLFGLGIGGTRLLKSWAEYTTVPES